MRDQNLAGIQEELVSVDLIIQRRNGGEKIQVHIANMNSSVHEHDQNLM